MTSVTQIPQIGNREAWHDAPPPPHDCTDAAWLLEEADGQDAVPHDPKGAHAVAAGVARALARDLAEYGGTAHAYLARPSAVPCHADLARLECGRFRVHQLAAELDSVAAWYLCGATRLAAEVLAYRLVRAADLAERGGAESAVEFWLDEAAARMAGVELFRELVGF